MSYIYEIHITCKLPCHELVHITNFINVNLDLWESLNLIRPHLCNAQSLYGDIPDQIMFTCCVKDYEINVISKLHIIRDKLIEYLRDIGINNTLIRNKIELKQRTGMVDLIDAKFPYNDHPYYEFHWKVIHDTKKFGHMVSNIDFDKQNLTIQEYKKFLTPEYFELEKIGLENSIHLSFNKDKDIHLQYPIATMRFHNCTKDYALDSLSSTLNKLEILGYKTSGTIQFEMAVYDDNINFDKGWIFKDKPEDIINLSSC